VHQVAAVELGGHVHREPQPAPGRLDAVGVGHGAHEVAAQADEGVRTAFEHALAGLHRVQPLLARRLEVVELGELVQRRELGLFGDADGALALHVRVAAHRADARARPADVAAQQQQVGQHLHVLTPLRCCVRPMP
jgi:hypothetical protein